MTHSGKPEPPAPAEPGYIAARLLRIRLRLAHSSYSKHGLRPRSAPYGADCVGYETHRIARETDSVRPRLRFTWTPSTLATAGRASLPGASARPRDASAALSAPSTMVAGRGASRFWATIPWWGLLAHRIHFQHFALCHKCDTLLPCGLASGKHWRSLMHNACSTTAGVGSGTASTGRQGSSRRSIASAHPTT